MSKIVQKRMKGNSLRFQLLPLRDSSSQGANNTDSNQNDNHKGPLWLGTFLLAILVTKYVIFKKYYFITMDKDSKTISKQSDSLTDESKDIWYKYLVWYLFSTKWSVLPIT